MNGNQIHQRPGYRAGLYALASPLLLGIAMHTGGLASAAVDGVWQPGPGNPGAPPAPLDGQVRSILADLGNRCYIGGGFDAPFDAVAYWNGTTYQSAGIPFWIGEASTNAMIEYQGQIHAAGRFPMPSGTAVLMRLEEKNGAPMWIPLAFSENDEGAEGLSLAVHNDLLWFGGEYELLDGTRNIATWNGFAASNVGDADGPVRALASHEGLLYAGGDFTNLGAACPPSFPGCPFDEDNLAVWDGDWSEAFGGTDAAVYALHSVGGTDPMAGLYVGGDFNSIGASVGHGGIARIHDENGPSTIDRMDGGPWSGKVRAIQRWGQGVAVGGTFTLVSDSDPTIAFNIATWTTANTWEPMDFGLEAMVTDMPYGAAVLALDRFMTPDSEGLHAGGNFASYGPSLDLCNYAARFLRLTTYEVLTPFVDAVEDGFWNQIDEHSYMLSPTSPGQPVSMTWGVRDADFQHLAWEPASLELGERLVFQMLDDRLPRLEVYRPQGENGPFLPPPVLEISPSISGAGSEIRIDCVTSSGETIRSSNLLLDETIRIDVSSLIEGVTIAESDGVWKGGDPTQNIGIRVGNPADTLVASTGQGQEIFNANDVVRFAIAVVDAPQDQQDDSGRFRVELIGDLAFDLRRSGFGVDGDLHRIDPGAAPDSLEIVETALGEPAVVYHCEEAGQAFEVEGTVVENPLGGDKPLYSRRSMMLRSATPGEQIGVLIEDRHGDLADPRNSLEVLTFEDRLRAIFQFDNPNLRGKVTFLGANGEEFEREIPDDLEFDVFIDFSNGPGIRITQDDESDSTILDWTGPGLVVFDDKHGLPPIEGPSGMIIGRVEGSDGDDTWDVLQRRSLRVTSTRRSDIMVSETEFTVIEGEDTGPVGDLNGDGIVNGADLALILAAWGACPGCPADLNGDGIVDGGDLAFILANWNNNFTRRAGTVRRR